MLSFLILWFVFSPICAQAQSTITFSPEFKIINEFNADLPMGVPLNVQTFSDGRFIIHEHAVEELKLFEADGTFIKNLSRSGRGPGEFIDIEHISISPSDNLLVVDHVQLKTTLMDLNGETEDYLNFKSRPRIRNIHYTDKDRMLVGYRPHINGQLASEHLFHFMNTDDFEFNLKGIVLSGQLADQHSSLPEEKIMDGSKRLTENSVLSLNKDLFIAPALYNGFILKLTQESEYTRAKKIYTREYGPSIIVREREKNMTFEAFENKNLNMISGREGSIFFHHMNKSMGLFYSEKDNLLFHFVQEVNDKGTELVLEIIDPDTEKVLNITSIDKIGELSVEDNLSEGDYKWIKLNLLYMDQQNRLFVSRFNRNNEPELHVFKVEIR